jgi:hypothetical protein
MRPDAPLLRAAAAARLLDPHLRDRERAAVEALLRDL